MKRWTIAFAFLVLPGLAFGTTKTQCFPQIGDGTAGSFKFQTSILFLNNGPAAEFVLEFRKGDGTPLEVDLEPLGKASSFSISLPSRHSLVAQTSGTGSLVTGYALFAAPETVVGTAVFSGTDLPNEVALFEAGVPASEPLGEFSILVDSIGKRNTGLALVHLPDTTPAQAAGGNTTVQFTLYDSLSNEVGTGEILLEPGQKDAKFVHELFPPGSEASETAREMQGTLRVTASGNPVAAVTLRQMEVSASFPAEVPVLTTLPVAPVSSGGESEWNLVWSDEFEGNTINLQKWEHQIGIGQSGWGNNELQYYTDRPENSRIEDGKLIIEAVEGIFGTPARQYTSARLRTRNKGDWKYGRFEIRAKLPEGKGIWPAIWMLPTDEVYGTWAASGEIDIVELVGHEPNRIHGTLHFGGEWPRHQSSGDDYVLPQGKFSDSFHVFALEWEEREMRWYVDDIHYLTQTSWHSNSASTPAPFPAPFDQRFHLLVNVAVGGNWPGTPDSSTVFPQRMEIDYVRVYQKGD